MVRSCSPTHGFVAKRGCRKTAVPGFDNVKTTSPLPRASSTRSHCHNAVDIGHNRAIWHLVTHHGIRGLGDERIPSIVWQTTTAVPPPPAATTARKTAANKRKFPLMQPLSIWCDRQTPQAPSLRPKLSRTLPYQKPQMGEGGAPPPGRNSAPREVTGPDLAPKPRQLPPLDPRLQSPARPWPFPGFGSGDTGASQPRIKLQPTPCLTVALELHNSLCGLTNAQIRTSPPRPADCVRGRGEGKGAPERRSDVPGSSAQFTRNFLAFPAKHHREAWVGGEGEGQPPERPFLPHFLPDCGILTFRVSNLFKLLAVGDSNFLRARSRANPHGRTTRCLREVGHTKTV